jgi:hypothetical protein
MVRSVFACLLSWTVIACSGDGLGSSEDAGRHDEDAADAMADSHSSDATPDDAAPDVHAPAPPSCDPGDRNEWSGTIPNTVIAVAVCSTCGESYVVLANSDTSASDVSLDNGTKTITTTVPAGGKATSAKIADKPSDGTVTVCHTSGMSKDCLPVSPENKEYCNPFRAITKLAPERIDQGVDYGGAGPIYAMGPGVVDVYRNRNDSGWPGGTFVSYKLSAGPASGKVIFLAENIDLDKSLHSGSKARATPRSTPATSKAARPRSA